jgi:hypothetical protein
VQVERARIGTPPKHAHPDRDWHGVSGQMIIEGGRIRQCECRWCGLKGCEAVLLYSTPPGVDLTHKYYWFDPDERWPGVNHTFTRGFVSAVTCTAEDWLTHADALCWHPASTDECSESECRLSSMPWRARLIVPRPDCPTCKGSGRVPRPCPPTAQPIVKVTLTGADYRFLVANEFSEWHGQGRVVWRSLRWPGVEFSLVTDVFPTVDLTAHSLTGLVYMTGELLRDSAVPLNDLRRLDAPPG